MPAKAVVSLAGPRRESLSPRNGLRRYQRQPQKVPAPPRADRPEKLPRRDVPRRCPVGRRRFRGAACRIRRHRDGDHVGIFVHRARGGIYPKSDDAAEDHIAGSHAFGVRRNEARSEQIAFLRALDRKRARPPGKGHRSRGRDYLRPALGLNSAACPWRARGINGDDLRRAPGDRRACDQHHGRDGQKDPTEHGSIPPAPGAPSSDNHCAKASTLCPNRTPWVLTRGLPLGRFLEGHSFGGALPDSSPTGGRALKA